MDTSAFEEAELAVLKSYVISLILHHDECEEMESIVDHMDDDDPDLDVYETQAAVAWELRYEAFTALRTMFNLPKPDTHKHPYC